MSKRRSTLVHAIFCSPFLWGAALAAGFYWLIQEGKIEHPLLLRYTASHPVEYITVTMFAVAMVSLLFKGLAALRERMTLSRVTLGEIPEEGQPVEACDDLLEQFAALPKSLQRTYLGGRLQGGLSFVSRTNSADKLADELQNLSEADADHQHASYALERVIIWAIPILGFLGTVMGITLAIANLSSAAGALEQQVPLVTSGLSVAFDTTALALALSLVLMFTQFIVDRLEISLLEAVDERARDELCGRFHLTGTGGDPILLAMRRMIDAVLATTETLIARQSELWQGTIESAHQQWQEVALRQEDKLGQSISQALQEHAERLESSEIIAAERHRKHWKQVHAALETTARALTDQKDEQLRQTHVLKQVVEATSEVTKLEDALNRNLSSLAKSANFEEVLLTMSTILHVLTTRLGVSEEQLKQIQLSRKDSKGQAA